eukprot:1446825-Rhodomonas_salina.1
MASSGVVRLGGISRHEQPSADTSSETHNNKDGRGQLSQVTDHHAASPRSEAAELMLRVLGQGVRRG